MSKEYESTEQKLPVQNSSIIILNKGYDGTPDNGASLAESFFTSHLWFLN